MKQTAVEWLINWGKQNPIAFQSDYYAAIEKAKEMEKEQIIDAWNNDDSIDAEYYYQETYQHPDPSDDEIFNNFNHEGGIKYETNS
jgi:hypothetical protein